MVSQRFIAHEKGIEINWAATATWMAKNKCCKMEVSTLKFKGIDLNVPCVSQKLSTDGNTTKSNVHLVSDYKVLKTLCSTRPYGVTTNGLKKVES